MQQNGEKGKTLVIGASPRTYRYSYLAVERLSSAGYPVVALGHHPGWIEGVPIETTIVDWGPIDTVTLYLNADHQKQYEDYLLELKPRRVIFNPGAENAGLEKRLKEHGIEALRACTLVMLSTHQY